MSTLMNELRGLRQQKDTKYASCVLPVGQCPRYSLVTCVAGCLKAFEVVCVLTKCATRVRTCSHIARHKLVSSAYLLDKVVQSIHFACTLRWWKVSIAERRHSTLSSRCRRVWSATSCDILHYTLLPWTYSGQLHTLCRNSCELFFCHPQADKPATNQSGAATNPMEEANAITQLSIGVPTNKTLTNVTSPVGNRTKTTEEALASEDEASSSE